MQRLIVVPLDGSRLSEQALPNAVALARATGSGLMLIRVATSPPEMLNTVKEYLESIAGRLEKEGASVQSRLAEGEAAEQIIAYVEQNAEIAMIVMATNGRSGLTRWMLGSVAEKVLQASPVPLVLIRPAADDVEAEVSLSAAALPAYRTILVPLDGSLLAEQAIEHAQKLAAATGASLRLLTVAPSLSDLALGTRADITRQVETLRDREKKRLGTYLVEVARRIEGAGITVRIQISEGNPAEEILRASRSAGADLIAMSTQGRSGLGRVWLGSVAMKVAHAAELPVLLARAVHRDTKPS